MLLQFFLYSTSDIKSTETFFGEAKSGRLKLTFGAYCGGYWGGAIDFGATKISRALLTLSVPGPHD